MKASVWNCQTCIAHCRLRCQTEGHAYLAGTKQVAELPLNLRNVVGLMNIQTQEHLLAAWHGEDTAGEGMSSPSRQSDNERIYGMSRFQFDTGVNLDALTVHERNSRCRGSGSIRP